MACSTPPHSPVDYAPVLLLMRSAFLGESSLVVPATSGQLLLLPWLLAHFSDPLLVDSFPGLLYLPHFPSPTFSPSLCLCRLKIASILITQRIALAVSICISFSVFHLIANKMYAISKVSMCPCVSIYLCVCVCVCVHGTCN